MKLKRNVDTPVLVWKEARVAPIAFTIFKHTMFRTKAGATEEARVFIANLGDNKVIVAPRDSVSHHSMRIMTNDMAVLCFKMTQQEADEELADKFNSLAKEFSRRELIL